jgi:hypothetical protein
VCGVLMRAYMHESVVCGFVHALCSDACMRRVQMRAFGVWIHGERNVSCGSVRAGCVDVCVHV